MLWGQRINIYTDHKNLTRDGLSLASDRVARWQILLKEYALEIIYIKGSIIQSRMQSLDWTMIQKLNTTNEYNHATHVKSTKVESNLRWMMFSKFWSCYNETQDQDEINPIEMNQVFANRSEDEEIYPLTVKEIVEAQKADPIRTHLYKSNAVLSKGLELQLVENKSCICH